MKRKCLFIIFLSLFLCGCTNVYDKKIDEIINNFNNISYKQNVLRTGYKYYLPDNLTVREYYLYNDIIESENNTFYLFVDMVSYYNKKELTYTENKGAYYSKKFNFNDKFGYLQIDKKENNQYLIEIIYNYAKIEVMVDEDEINLALNYAISILNSVEYSDNIIANLVGENVLNFEEKDYNIFDDASQESNYIKYDEDIIILEDTEENE